MSKVTAYLYKEDEMKILVIDDGNRELTTVVFSGQQQSFFPPKTPFLFGGLAFQRSRVR